MLNPRSIIRVIGSFLRIQHDRWRKDHERLYTIWGDRTVANLTEASAPPIRDERPRQQLERDNYHALTGPPSVAQLAEIGPISASCATLSS